MRSLLITSSVAVYTLILILFAVPLFAGSMGTSDGYDLDKLLEKAEKDFDLSGEDAILLLESRHITISESGALRTRIHSVVWVGTKAGIVSYADLRIPYNSTTSNMKVVKLRTWRENKWWPDKSEVSSTAVVETLPFELAGADDYTNMRETMLLHDGVEIPCILETLYEIEEPGGAKYGNDGLWIFPRNDPAVLVEYNVTVPAGRAFHFVSGNHAPQEAEADKSEHTVSYMWKMEKVDRLGSPHIAEPAMYAPYVVWSTWKDWDELGSKIDSNFNEAALLSAALADSLAKKIEHEPSPAAAARAVVGFINEYTRGIHYDSGFWFLSPRPADRTWETAYGHCLDRAVLAAALLRGAGLDAEAVYRSKGFGGIDYSVPGLSLFNRVGLMVKHGSFQGFYDPVEGKLYEGLSEFYGRMVWTPASGNAPLAAQVDDEPGAVSSLNLNMTITPGEEGCWRGAGYYSTDGLFCPYDKMAGLSDEATVFIGSMAASVLERAEVSGFNPEVFGEACISGGFKFQVSGEDPDKQGRTRISIGDPAGGIISNLPSDVRLYHERRTSPVMLKGNMNQRVSVRIKMDGKEIVYLPEEREIENEAGRYILKVENKNGWVTIDRELQLSSLTISPETWPQLRALLLEETDPGGRTVIIR